jgi:hypothetical protein
VGSRWVGTVECEEEIVEAGQVGDESEEREGIGEKGKERPRGERDGEGGK